MSYSTPVLFLIYNRPEMTKRVFAAIRKQRPLHLFVAADGPVQNNAEAAEKCRITRETVINNVDWDCEVSTLFRDGNLGCGRAVSGAITWFFEQVEEGVILEDDCLPNDSFFLFCQELLAKYRSHDSIMSIGGASLFKNNAGAATYFFSVYTLVWGWASWRNAWQKYRFDLDEHSLQAVNEVFNRKAERKFWSNIYRHLNNGEIDTWDYQWNFAIWEHKGLTVIPKMNLVSNIGFNGEATHTHGETILSGLALQAMGELCHPRKIRQDRSRDRILSRLHGIVFSKMMKRILIKIRKWL